MGSAYEHLSREELLALLAAKGEPTHAKDVGADPSDPPSSGDRYRQVVEEAADGIFLSDDAAVYLDVNEAGARMLGMAKIRCRAMAANTASRGCGPTKAGWMPNFRA